MDPLLLNLAFLPPVSVCGGASLWVFGQALHSLHSVFHFFMCDNSKGSIGSNVPAWEDKINTFFFSAIGSLHVPTFFYSCTMSKYV